MVDFKEELCEVIAQLTEGFSFAYLKELFVIVLLTIARGGTGDEVEEEETPVAPETSPSEDGHVVVEHEDAKGESGDNMEKKEEREEKEAEKPAPPKIKRVMPEVEIPESLQENVLLKVVKGQIKMLLDEMDNTEEGKWPSEKTQGGGVPGHKKPVRVRRARRAC